MYFITVLNALHPKKIFTVTYTSVESLCLFKIYLFFSSTDQTMSTIQARLLKTLDNLSKEKLDRFKWLLKKNHDSISVADIENANAFKTVDIMEAQFTPEGAVGVTLDILRMMNENNLAQQLEEYV